MIVAVPNAPRLFSVLAINSSAVLLTWRRLSERDARGVIRGYYFHQSEIGPGGNRIGEPKVIIVSIIMSAFVTPCAVYSSLEGTHLFLEAIVITYM